MPLSAGVRLGPYEVIALLGAGGMGEVYKARDTRLGRDVAIKVLHASISADGESRRRFEREARTISQLNHPHICVLYDVGETTPGVVSGGPGTETTSGVVSYLVMEFLEGESLAARIARGPIPADEALGYAMQIADALDKAHRQGVVHRDLKPANVMLIKSGAARSTVTTTLPGPSIAKLLDFGLAKLAPPPSVGSLETVLAPSGLSRGTSMNPATAKGTILGTFQYMAPEQVEAGEVDARADIWAFGCVLYKMLTGKPAFEGKTQASMIAGILERDPTPVSELQPLTPPALGRVVRICLAKDPDSRFQSAFDLLLQLQWIAEGGSAAGVAAPVVAHRKRRERAMWLAMAALTLALGAAGAWMLKPAPVVSSVVGRFSFVLPEGQAFSRTSRRFVAISPDGKRMAYVADKRLYLREMHQLTALPIAGTEEDPLEPVFSPDGLWIAYFVPGGGSNFTLKKIQIGGGTPVPLCPTGWPYGASWRDHTIVFGQNSGAVRGIQSVPDTAGTATTLLTVGNDETATHPSLMEDGALLFTVKPNATPSWDDATVVLQAPGDSARTVLVKNGTDGHLLAGDRLVYYRNGTIFGIGVDVRARATRGGAVPIVDGVQATTLGSGAGVFAVADAGALVFVPGTGGESEPRQLVWVDRQGKEELIHAPERSYIHPRLSPDGKRIVVAAQEGTGFSLFTWELERRVFSQLTRRSDHEDSAPLWTVPDGRSVIYRSWAPDGTGKIMRIDASGAGAPEVLLDLGKVGVSGGSPESVSPDGKLVTFRLSKDRSPAVVVLPLDGSDRTPRPLLAGPLSETHGRISPDGRWLVYSMGETELQAQVFVRPYPNVDADRWQLSTGVMSTDSVWARSSREVFFLDRANKLVRVTVQPGPVFGRPDPILDNGPYLPAVFSGVNYDVSLDGQRFLMIKRRGLSSDISPTITIVTHWIDELKARVK